MVLRYVFLISSMRTQLADLILPKLRPRVVPVDVPMLLRCSCLLEGPINKQKNLHLKDNPAQSPSPSSLSTGPRPEMHGLLLKSIEPMDS